MLYQSLTNHNLPTKQRHQVVVKVEILLLNHNMKKQIHLIQKKLSKMTARVLFIKVIFSNLNAGAPIGIPNRLASSLLEIAQPSLLDKTTTGFFLILGLNNLSQET